MGGWEMVQVGKEETACGKQTVEGTAAQAELHQHVSWE